MASVRLELHHKRYFTNPYLNSTHNHEAQVTREWLVQQITALTNKLINREISDDEISEGKHCVYTGLGGIAYAFLRVIKSVNPSNAEEILAVSQEYIKSQLQYSKPQYRYLTGTLGLHIVDGILCSMTGQPLTEVAANVNNLELQLQHASEDEILNGRAGFLAGLLTLKMEAGQNVVKDEKIHRILADMMQSGRDYARRSESESPLMYEWHGEYLGAAHGLAGTLQMFLSYWNYLNDKDKSYVKGSVDWLLSLQTSSGNFPSSSKHIGEEKGENELVHWCHGAGGVIYLFIVAYMVIDEKKYLNAAHACSNLIWEKGILQKGPGICHGVAGSGYAFLMMYRLTQDEAYLTKAKIFALILMNPDFQKNSRTPDRPYSLFEGWAGALCFLCDLLEPNKAQFPFVPIPMFN